MVVNHHKIQKIGWYPWAGTSASASELDAESKFYNVGIREQVASKLPLRELDVAPIYRGGNRDVEDWNRGMSKIDGGLGIIPYNGIWFYYGFGDSVGAEDVLTDGTKHTLAGINTGRLPEFEIRWQSQSDDGATPTNIRSVSGVGCKVNTLSLSIDLMRPISYMSLGLAFMGTRHPTDTYQNNWATQNLPKETGTTYGTEQVDFLPYLRDSNMIIEYQPDGASAVDMSL
jgi:hypothetical protein